MKIIDSKPDILLSLKLLDSYIEVQYKNRRKFLASLNSIDIVLEKVPVFDETQKVATLHPVLEFREIKYTLYPDSDPDWSVSIRPADFHASDDFYNLAKGVNAPFKIIRDKFSIKRGISVMQYLGEIEIGLREAYLQHTNEQYSKASKERDHPINSLTLSDMVFKELLSKSSNEFYLQKIKEATSNEDYLSARSLSRIDELGIPLTRDEFERLISARNAVMHFKVVTLDDVDNIISTVQKLHHYRYGRLIERYLRETNSQ